MAEEAASRGISATRVIRAAAYARMSTDHQVYSIKNQLAAIGEYAERNGLAVVREYLDPGRSGLHLDGRLGLVKLLTDVQEGRADFEVILIYDVSRWGRFQDIDESAYYEFACRKANIRVVYCAEPFDNESGGALASIIKSIKRIMAAEFSRDQSLRVRRAKLNIVSQRFFAGGSVPFGLRRAIVSMERTQLMVVEAGVHKALGTVRTILVPGPLHERRLVLRIFRLYAQSHRKIDRIVETLNREGKPPPRSRTWTHSTVGHILQNEVYIGTLVYNRTTSLLRTRKRRNDSRNWIHVERAFEPIVPEKLFHAAQARRAAHRYRRYTDDEMLDWLRQLHRKHGRLSEKIIRGASGGPHVSVVKQRFGGLFKVYERVGFTQHRRSAASIASQHLVYAHFRALQASLVEFVRGRGGRVARKRGRGATLTIEGTPSLSIAIARYVPPTATSAPRWIGRVERVLRSRYFIVGRMNEANDGILDYFLLPGSMVPSVRIRFTSGNLTGLAPYHCPNLAELLERVVEALPALCHPQSQNRL